jgi:hypothetical protein
VDLGSTQNVKAIAITNRGDCCGSRLTGFSVLVGSTKCASNVAIAQGESKLVTCNGVGSTVRVQMNKRTPLTICEFRVAVADDITTTTTTTTEASTTTPAPVSTTPFITPGTGAPSSASTGTVTGVFDKVDTNDNNKITRTELQKALDDGTVKLGVGSGPVVPTVMPTVMPPTVMPTVAPTMTPATGGAGAFPSQAQIDAIVMKHNALRGGLGASDMMKMEWDATLAVRASAYVAGCPSGHSQNRGMSIGENIAWKWASNFQLTASTDVTASIQAWYDEISAAGQYKDGGTFTGFGQCTGVCGHYTQVVWAAANKIGCGLASCPHRTGMPGYELVCQYSSSVGRWGGNMRGATLFTKGAQCSKCPSGYTKCDLNLCAAGA